jgi:hypothetical protein
LFQGYIVRAVLATGPVVRQLACNKGMRIEVEESVLLGMTGADIEYFTCAAIQ